MTTIGKIYKYKNYLFAPLYRKFIGVKDSNGVLHKGATLASHSQDRFVFETTYARIRTGEKEVEIFKSTREPDGIVEYQDEAIVLKGYLLTCCCF